jgi:translation elongation factor EF-G
MGDCTLRIIIDRLKREFKVEINQGAPQVAYKEALTKSVEHKEVYKKQTGGRGKFADIVFEIGPRDDMTDGKTGLEFVNDIVGGVIPRDSFLQFRRDLSSQCQTVLLQDTRSTHESKIVPRFLPRCGFRFTFV